MKPNFIYEQDANRPGSPRCVYPIYGEHIDLDTCDPDYGQTIDQSYVGNDFTEAERYIEDKMQKITETYKRKHPEINNVIRDGITYNYLTESGGWTKDGNGYYYRLWHYIGNPDNHNESKRICIAYYRTHRSQIIERTEWK